MEHCESLAVPCVQFDKLRNGNLDAVDSFVQAVNRHSFCVLDLDADLEACFRLASQRAGEFFTQTASDTKRGFQCFVDEYDGLARGLVGFNTPSAAKEVFRIRDGNMSVLWQTFPVRCCLFLFNLRVCVRLN
jgi:hypothetical protein